MADFTFIGSGGEISFPLAAVDAFGRQRVSNPFTEFESQFQYDLQPLIWESQTAGGGTVTHLLNESSVSMALGTANGDLVVRQTKEYFRYQPGKSRLVIMTGVLGPEKTNVISRISSFDVNNGVYFYRDDQGLAVGLRTFTSGAPVDTLVRQADWNLDPMDGTGPSGITLDADQAQIMVIDLQWLGVGRIRYGWDIGGDFVYCHATDNANLRNTVYMTTGNLPFRYEIRNVGVAPSASEMKQICSTIIGEGGFMPYGVVRGVDLGATARAATAGTAIALISIRLRAAYNRATVIPLNYNVIPTGGAGGDVLSQLVLNANLANPVWNDVAANAATQVDIAASAVAGGTVIWSNYTNEAGGNLTSVLSSINLTSNLSGTSDTLSIVSTPVANANLLAALNYRELF